MSSQEYLQLHHFETLSLTPSATPSDINSAYRKLSLKHHPDKPTGNHEMFTKLLAAKEYCLRVLSLPCLPPPQPVAKSEREIMHERVEARWAAMSEEDRELGRTPISYKPSLKNRFKAWRCPKPSFGFGSGEKQAIKLEEQRRAAERNVLAQARAFTAMQADARANGIRC